MGPNPPFPIISAVVAPALLILACSSLITTTANRLSLLLERVRQLTHDLESADGRGSSDAKCAFLAQQLLRGTDRARLLQRTLATLYLTLGSLIFTSVCVGIGAVVGLDANLLGGLVLVSVSFLFYASTLLIRESRIALTAVNAEMEYVRRLAQQN